MASPVQAHYANRKTNNVYDSLSKLITSSSTGFLSNCEYEKDFHRKTTWHGLDFQNKDSSEFRVNLFGEIQPESLGTKHSALGDFYIGTKEKVRLCFDIGCLPTSNLFLVDVLLEAHLYHCGIKGQEQVRSRDAFVLQQAAWHDVSRPTCSSE